jgi:hypothetical protein
MEYDQRALIGVVMELREELGALKEEMVALMGGPREKPQRAPCGGVTGKGVPCRNRALVGTGFCGMHGERRVAVVKAKRAPKPPKAKKVQPEHTHVIGGDSTGCPLCGTHGDVWDQGLPFAEFCQA